ncbi:hypothetical protein GPECTOR_10g1143 [Gonium pectorale]|uniref:Reverse transcriptase domain-containing protein n=1 Tax=Gonium pectorale TaxID=33097 RepID=A0A150GS34_GONPE|nr:hypothetical protein GPECTOR_10g1143 [Gonium pectorale]|eukprot:KXZ52120.1 hypothetical protein GPECTOR_10g1143 [Gonium pectorale]
MESTRYPTFDPFHYKGLDRFVQDVRHLCITEPRIKRGAAHTAAQAKAVLDALPVRYSSYETWYGKHKATLLADAAAHYNVQENVLSAEQLLDFFVALLDKHFETPRVTALLAEIKTAAQGSDPPSLFLQRLMRAEKGLAGRVSQYEVGERFVDGLIPAVGEPVKRTLCAIPKSEWYARLPKTAEEADVVWNNLSEHERKPPKDSTKEPRAPKASPAHESKPSQESGSERRRRDRYPRGTGRYYCELHGPNYTHNTVDCEARRAGQSRTAAVTKGGGELEGIMQQLRAFLSQGEGGDRSGAHASSSTGASASGRTGGASRSQGGDNGRHRDRDRYRERDRDRDRDRDRARDRDGDRGRYRDREPCSYCGRGGHDDSGCWIKHPELAHPNYEPPGSVLKALFEQNQAKSAKKGKAAAAAKAVVEDDYSETDDERDEREVRKACATQAKHRHAMSVTGSPTVPLSSVYWERMPTTAFGMPVGQDNAGQQRTAMATLRSQAVPTSFEPAPLGSDYPPRVPAPAQQPAQQLPTRREVQAQIDELLEQYRRAMQSELLALVKGSAGSGAQGSEADDGSTRAHKGTQCVPSELPSCPSSPSTSSQGPVAGAGGTSEAAAAATSRIRPPDKFRTPQGLQYQVSGAGSKPPRTLAEMDVHERGQALTANPAAANYLQQKPGMYYYPPGAACIRQLDGHFMAKDLMRDPAADVNVIPAEVAHTLKLPVVPTSTRLSTSTDTGGTVLGELDTDGLSLVMLPGTPHETAVPLTLTLVSDIKPTLFNFLVGNEQAKLLGDGLDSYPQPMLHFRPNFIEHPDYKVTIPMRPTPHSAQSARNEYEPPPVAQERGVGADNDVTQANRFGELGRAVKRVVSVMRYAVGRLTAPIRSGFGFIMAVLCSLLATIVKEKQVIAEKTAELVKSGIVVEHRGPTMCAVNPVIAAKKDPETDQPKTAYWCDNKLMMYTRMPYGLKNASAKFQRVMDYEIGKAGLDHCAVSFVDDVLIFSESPEQHVRDVAAVLDMLHACGLRAHPDKSIFGADVIEYLGHNLTAQGISPHHAKVAAIMSLQPPTNVSELRAQLGFINYYRCYVPGMSQLTADLTKLLKKDEPWVWGPDQQAAYDAIKAVFVKEGLILRRIDYDKPLILHTDFSNRGIGAVLGQLDDDGNEYMCACISRSLNKHEKNYSSYKGEMLAAVWAVKMFRHHLLGGPKFKLVTDTSP